MANPFSGTGAFDLARFRDLAFGRESMPDHPMQSEAEARKLIALLPEGDPAHALAELTHWTASINATQEFTPGRRARILLLLHEASRPLWRELGQRYLAPDDVPTEGAEGDPAILRAMWDSASEFSDGFAISLDPAAQASKWVRANLAALLIRNLRWLSRRLALAYMLQGGQTGAIWERLHRLYQLAVAGNALQASQPANEGARYHTTPQIEYVRPLLLELANPGAMRPREVELLYRIAARIAPAARLDSQRSDESNFAVEPAGDKRPVAISARKAKGHASVYIATANCLPRLRAALERDTDRDPGEEDTLFGRGYTRRERYRVLGRALDHWGMDPPQRRASRIRMAAPARVIAGFESVLSVLPPPAQGVAEDAAAARRRLQVELDESGSSLNRAKVRAARVGPARVIDASAGGLGIALRRADAPWAAHRALLAITIEPGRDWFLGILQRIFAVDEELRLGIQILAAKPKVVMLRIDTVEHEDVWADAVRRQSTFDERYRRGILLEPQALPLVAGEILLPPGLAAPGTRFGVPLPQGEQYIRITKITEDSEHYQRAVFATRSSGP